MGWGGPGGGGEGGQFCMAWPVPFLQKNTQKEAAPPAHNFENDND